jgi:hypothetical protein
VILFRDAEGYWVSDGHHRCRAAKQVGFRTIQAEVRAGGEREAFLYACSANATHGWQRDELEIRHIVSRLLTDEEWGRWSDREIARRCAVSHPFVGKIRAEMAERSARASGNGYQMTETRTAQRGESVYAMDTSRIGTGAESTTPMDGAPTPAAPRPRRRGPAQLSTEAQEKRRWYYLTAGLSQIITEFAHGGGIKPLLGVWTVGDSAAARAQLARHRDEIDRLDAAIAACETALEDRD